jgi:hypothetical protein
MDTIKTSDGTQVWNWGRFIGARDEEDITMTALKNPAIEKAAEALRVASGDEEVRRQYDLRQRMLMDEEARRVFAEREGMQKGIQKGMTQGRTEILDLLRSGKSPDEILRAYSSPQ